MTFRSRKPRRTHRSRSYKTLKFSQPKFSKEIVSAAICCDTPFLLRELRRIFFNETKNNLLPTLAKTWVKPVLLLS
jgi:hypothetical protein